MAKQRCCALQAFSAPSKAMQCQRLRHLSPDALQRVQRGHRVLKDHGDLRPSDVAKAARRRPKELFTLKSHMARADADTCRQ
jgi:hypothetical protein